MSFHFTFEAAIQPKLSSIWGAHVVLPAEVKSAMDEQGIQRLVVTFDGAEANSVHTAPVAIGAGMYMLHCNQKIQKAIGKTIGDLVKVEIKEDTSEYGVPLCAELQEFMLQDPAFKLQFDALKPGVQRAIIYIINKPKSSNKRIDKTLALIAAFPLMPASGFDFKIYHAQIKEIGK